MQTTVVEANSATPIHSTTLKFNGGKKHQGGKRRERHRAEKLESDRTQTPAGLLPGFISLFIPHVNFYCLGSIS